nr:hypothetical protein [Paenibacillus xylanexedens]
MVHLYEWVNVILGQPIGFNEVVKPGSCYNGVYLINIHHSAEMAMIKEIEL